MSEDKDDKWEMPTPVFRTTSGALPRSFEETISQSFMPHADTIEMTETLEMEDEDLLSIMDTPSESEPEAESEDESEVKSEDLDDEAITETPDVEPEPEAKISEVQPTADPDQSKPIVVTAKKPAEKPTTKSDGSGSKLFIFVLIALIAAGIVAGVFYYLSYYRSGNNGPF